MTLSNDTFLNLQNWHDEINRSAEASGRIAIAVSRAFVASRASDELERLLSAQDVARLKGRLTFDTGNAELAMTLTLGATARCEALGRRRGIEIEISGSFRFHPVSEPETTYRSRDFSATVELDVAASDVTAAGAIFAARQDKGFWTVALPTSPPAAELISKFYENDEVQYRVDEQVALQQANLILRQTLSELVPFPDVRSTLITFKLAGPIRVITTNDNYFCLTGMPETKLNSCAYSPSEHSPVASIPGISPCGEIIHNELFYPFGVRYPEAGTIARLGEALAGISIVASDSAVMTWQYYEYQVTALLASISSGIDSNLKIALAATFNLSGKGSAGLVTPGCNGIRQEVARADVKEPSTFSTSATAEPCLDDTNLYLKGEWNATLDLSHVDWVMSGAGGDIVSWIMRSLLGALGANMQQTLKQSFQVALFSRSGMAKETQTMFWAKDSKPGSYLIALGVRSTKGFDTDLV